jgi:hypothetical protein
MHMKIHRPVTAAVAAVFFVALLGWSSGGHAAAATATTFSGRATVIQGQVAGIAIGPIVDTGPVDAGGGSLHESLLEYQTGLPAPANGSLSAEVLHAAVVAHGNKSSAEAFVASFSLSTLGQSVEATVLSARASATCNGSTASVSGSSQVAGLTVNGQTIAVTGQANQEVPVPGFGVIVVNEQIASASGQNGDITVNALHIVLTDPLLGTRTDLIVASAHADIACGLAGPGDCANKDFVTGGGWITRSGARATFAVAGGPGGWGHLQYIDHASGFKVKGTGVTDYGPGTTGATSRQIDGTATWTGGGGTYHAEVADNGEPGRNDTFRLMLSNGYGAAGLLDGGNIQLHCK